jgi:hypothetical protein
LLVWHIDQGQVEQHGFTADNRVNVGSIHGVALEQADGLNHLRHPGGGNRGDIGDSYPGATGNTSLCRATSPAAKDNQGGFARFCLESIRLVYPGPRIAFRYVSYRSVFASNHPSAVIRVNGTPFARLDQFFFPGTVIQLSADSVQTAPSGRTRFDFLAWSDGGSRTHSVTSDEVPDTIVAHMSARHRLRMNVQGAAFSSVTSGLGTDVGSGVFLSEGTQVALRATPPTGFVFSGWVGDTTAVSDTLSLTMHHPFDVTANFLRISEVPLTQAADVLFGKGLLGADQATYLDVVGNRNGVYDLGDFLATLTRQEKQDPDLPDQARVALGGAK